MRFLDLIVSIPEGSECVGKILYEIGYFSGENYPGVGSLYISDYINKFFIVLSGLKGLNTQLT